MEIYDNVSVFEVDWIVLNGNCMEKSLKSTKYLLMPRNDRHESDRIPPIITSKWSHGAFNFHLLEKRPKEFPFKSSPLKFQKKVSTEYKPLTMQVHFMCRKQR